MYRGELAAKIYPVDELAAKRLFTIPMLEIDITHKTSLLYAFGWIDTPYGSTYWSRVHSAVSRYYNPR